MSRLLSRGEALLVYTDGVTEAVNPGNEFFGEKRLIAAMQKHAPYAAARALVDETVNAVEEFVEQREQFDDLESGGMGIGLVRKLASGLHYRREADLNILVARFAPK